MAHEGPANPSTGGEPSAARRGRPRNPAAEKQVLEAALMEYAEHGWSGLTMDGVAKRAGVGKSTLYLRWTDKERLLHDAAAAKLGESVANVDTGSLRGDLIELTRNFFGHFNDATGWAALRMSLDSAIATTSWNERGTELVSAHGSRVMPIIDRAIERGELADMETAAQLMYAVYGSVTIQALTLAQRGRIPPSKSLEASTVALVDFLLPDDPEPA